MKFRLPEVLEPLMKQENWVIWRWVGDVKPPFQGRRPNKHASVTDADTWCSYNVARRAAAEGDGVGFVLSGSNIGALDLDDCRDPRSGRLDDWAHKMVEKANGHLYVEKTPSGKGVRIIGRTTNGSRHTRREIGDGKVEIFCNTARYITITGEEIGRCERLGNIDALADEVLKPAAVYEARKDASPSGLFFMTCCRMFEKRWSLERIEREFRDHPMRYKATSAGRYGDRLGQEIKRCYLKWQPQSSDSETALISRRASDIEMRRVRWLWPNRFAIGKIGIIVGAPDQGKSQVALDMVARIGWGKPWPDGGYAPEGDAIVLSAEDDAEDTLVPRLVAAGANLHRIEVISMTKRDGHEHIFSLADDLELLERKIAEMEQVRMILIDPITAYLGVGKIDSYRTSDIRGVLAPLAEMASRLRVAVVCITHFNKSDKMSAINRITDSLAFAATARHTYAVVREASSERVLFLKVKNNLASQEAGAKGLAFTIEGRTLNGTVRTSHIEWDDETVHMTIDEALQQASKDNGRRTNEREKARKLILEMLEGGAIEETKISEQAETHSISHRTLRRASEELEINKYQEDRKWWWELP